MVLETAECRSTTPTQVYALSRVSTGGHDRADDRHLLQGLLEDARGRGIHSRRYEAYGLRALELTGVDDEGHPFIRRHYAAGDGVITAEVTATGKRLERRAADAFFESLTYELPFTIRAFPRAAVSIAMPTHGIEAGAMQLHEDRALAAQAVLVGGTDALAFTIRVYEIPNHLQGLALEQRLLLLPYLLPDPRHEIETRSRQGTLFQRSRVLATDHEILSLSVAANNAAAVSSDVVSRFFESLQFFDQW
jgi:hypothetical protein